MLKLFFMDKSTAYHHDSVFPCIVGGLVIFSVFHKLRGKMHPFRGKIWDKHVHFKVILIKNHGIFFETACLNSV